MEYFFFEITGSILKANPPICKLDATSKVTYRHF